jgi:hypothetical protein
MKNWQLLISGVLAGAALFIGFIFGLRAMYIIAEEDEALKREEAEEADVISRSW